MNKKLLGLVISSTLVIASFSANAEDAYQGSWYALPGISYMNTDSDLEADNGAGGFLRFGKQLSEHWDVQLGAGHARADSDFPNTTGKFKQTLFGVDALYMFSRDRFRPFLLAGLGLAKNDVDYQVNGIDRGDDKTSWMVNAGLGAQFMVNEVFGIQADVRHVISKAEANGFANLNDDTIGNTYLNLGAIFNFGAPKPQPVAAPVPVVAAEPLPEIAPVDEEPIPPMEEKIAVAEPCKPKFEKIVVQAEKLFGFDKAALREDGKASLDAAAAKLLENTDIEMVMVTGHTDRLGSDAYNQKLSERRANQVKAYLVTKGVSAERLHAVGKGETEPVVACDGIKGRKKLIECLQPNRRVELTAEKVHESGCN